MPEPELEPRGSEGRHGHGEHDEQDGELESLLNLLPSSGSQDHPSGDELQHTMIADIQPTSQIYSHAFSDDFPDNEMDTGHATHPSPARDKLRHAHSDTEQRYLEDNTSRDLSEVLLSPIVAQPYPKAEEDGKLGDCIDVDFQYPDDRGDKEHRNGSADAMPPPPTRDHTSPVDKAALIKPQGSPSSKRKPKPKRWVVKKKKKKLADPAEQVSHTSLEGYPLHPRTSKMITYDQCGIPGQCFQAGDTSQLPPVHEHDQHGRCPPQVMPTKHSEAQAGRCVDDFLEISTYHDMPRTNDNAAPKELWSNSTYFARQLPINTPIISDETQVHDPYESIRIAAQEASRKHDTLATQYGLEKVSWQAELQEANYKITTLDQQVQTLQRETLDLARLKAKQAKKIAAFETKANKLKAFMEGLGNDMDYLKREATSNRHKARDLERELDERKDVQDMMSGQISSCTEEAMKLKDGAIRTNADLKAELAITILRAETLSQQVHEKTTQLAEEKSLRSKFQEELGSAADAKGAISQYLEANKDALLEKLIEIHALIKGSDHSHNITKVLEQTSIAVQGLTSQQADTSQKVGAINSLIETIPETVTNALESKYEQCDRNASLGAYLREAMDSLKADLCQQEGLVKQNSESSATIAQLRDKLSAKDLQVLELNKDLKEARATEKGLREHSAALQASLQEAYAKVDVGAALQSQLDHATATMQTAASEHEIAKNQLSDKCEEVRTLAVTRSELHDQIARMQDQLDEMASMHAARGDQLAETAAWEVKLQEAVLSARQEAAVAAQEFHNDQASSWNNEIRQRIKERDQAAKRAKPLQIDLDQANSQLEQLREERKRSNAETNQGLRAAIELGKSREEHIDTLQSSLSSLENSLHDRPTKEEFTQLVSLLADERLKAIKSAKDYHQLQTQIAELKAAVEQSHAAHEQALVDHSKALEKERETVHDLKETLRTTSRAAVETKEQLEKRAAEGLEQYKVSLDAYMAGLEQKKTKQIAALQQRLEDEQREAQTKTAQEEDFRLQLQKSWQAEQEMHETQMGQTQERAMKAEVERDEALAANRNLQDELAKALLLPRQDENTAILAKNIHQHISSTSNAHIEASLAAHAGQSSNSAASQSRSRISISKVGTGVTPVASSATRRTLTRSIHLRKQGEPDEYNLRISRPWKVKENALESPEPLGSSVLEDSQQALVASLSSGDHATVVDELRTIENVDEETQQMQYSDAGFSRPPNHNLSGTSAFTDLFEDEEILHVPSTLQETPLDPPITLFAEFNAAQSATKVAREVDPVVNQLRISHSSRYNEELESEQIQLDNTSHTSTREAPELIKDVLDYNFRKPTPAPNSSSKLVRSGSNTARRMAESDNLNPNSAFGLVPSQYKTPEKQANSKQSLPLTSSPDFINKARQTRHSTKTFHRSASNKNKRNFASQAIPARATKRKAGGNIMEGDKQERKRRLAGNSQHNLRSLSQSETVPSRKDSQTAPTPESRMRTFASGPAQERRRPKRTSRVDEISARFEQELSSRV